MSTIRLMPSGREIACEAGRSILEALEASGYALPNNCRAGGCGECKCRVLSGDVDEGLVITMSLTQQEKDDGFVLACMAQPRDPVIEIEYGTEDAQPRLFPPRENQYYTVVDRIPRTPRIVELRLRPIGKPMRFWPGQYVLFGDKAAGAPPRPYSLANAPRQDGEIKLQIARVEDGTTSKWVHDTVKAGDRVTLSGPYGLFIGDPSVETPVLLLAAGCGLAPIASLTEAALARGFRHPVTLIFSGKTAEDVYDLGLLAYWQQRYRNFKVRTTLTQATEPLPGGMLGRIPDILPDLFPDLSGHSVFIAGGPEFVQGCHGAVMQQGAQEHLVHVEGHIPIKAPEIPPQERLLATA